MFFDKHTNHLEKIGVTKNQIIDIFDNLGKQNNTKSGTVAVIYEVATTNQETQKFNDVDGIIDSLTTKALLRGNFPPYLTDPFTGSEIGNNFGAYDIIGNRSLGINLYNQATDSWTVQIVDGLAAIEWVTAALDIINLNFKVEIVVTFPDGSKGIMGFDRFDDLVFDNDSFVDSENNAVPFDANDVSNRNFFFSGGQESSGYRGFTRRLGLIGVSHGSSSGGGACSFSCSAQHCILTCSAN